MLNTLSSDGMEFTPSGHWCEESEKEGFPRQKLGSGQLNGFEGGSSEDHENQGEVQLRKALGLLGCSLEKDARKAVRAGSWPTSGRPICLKAEAIAARYPTVPGASCLSWKR